MLKIDFLAHLSRIHLRQAHKQDNKHGICLKTVGKKLFLSYKKKIGEKGFYS
jgi:hypothetical protein